MALMLLSPFLRCKNAFSTGPTVTALQLVLSLLGKFFCPFLCRLDETLPKVTQQEHVSSKEEEGAVGMQSKIEGTRSRTFWLTLNTSPISASSGLSPFGLRSGNKGWVGRQEIGGCAVCYPPVDSTDLAISSYIFVITSLPCSTGDQSLPIVSLQIAPSSFMLTLGW